MIPKPAAIWAEQDAPEGETSPFGCLDCPPNTRHEQIYLVNGTSFCHTHAHIRQGQAIDNEFSN